MHQVAVQSSRSDAVVAKEAAFPVPDYGEQPVLPADALVNLSRQQKSWVDSGSGSRPKL